MEKDTVIYLGIIDFASRQPEKGTARRAVYGLLRNMTTAFIGVPPAEMEISLGPRGKPRFTRLADVHFSLSHSGSLAACALGPVPLGVDLEVVRERRGWVDIAKAFFSEQEQLCLETRGAEALGTFYHFWTRKEAWLKLHGLSVWQVGKAPPSEVRRGRGPDFRTWRGEGSASLSLSLCVQIEGKACSVRFPAEFNSGGIKWEEVDRAAFDCGP